MPADMPPLPQQNAPHKPLVPMPPADPSWWRLGSVPFLVLVMAAASADFAWPRSGGWGIGAGIGCLLACGALLLLRKDFSKGERFFLGGLAFVNFVALLVSGSLFNWWCNLILPLFMVIIPRRQKALLPGQRFRNWWSYWTSVRLKNAPGESGSRLQGLRNILPLLICILVGVSLFVVFLIIFASGNPVVKLVFDWIADTWNSIVAYLHLSWNFLVHMLYWFVGIIWFGIYTLRRPDAARAVRGAAPAKAEGNTILPYLPICSLIGVDLAFFVATSTDIAYLWFGRVPEGLSQTAYLHDGAESITWASALAAVILIYLFRSGGSARRSAACRVAGYLLVLQTFLLAASVYVRLYYQISDCGFTVRRVQAAEAMLLGVAGLVVLVCYMVGSGAFRKYAKACLGSMLLLLIAFSVCSAGRLTGNLNMRYAVSHPQWSFSYLDFGIDRFNVEENLAFACYVQDRSPNENLLNKIVATAHDVEKRALHASWLNWNVSFSQDAEVASRVLGRPVEIKLSPHED